MRKSQELTKSQKQLLYLLPVLNDRQVAGMLSTLKKPARRAEKNDAYRQLMNMTGCAEAKEQLTAMLAAHRMSHIAESRSRTVKQPYFHAVFIPAAPRRPARACTPGRSRRRASRSTTALPS